MAGLYRLALVLAMLGACGGDDAGAPEPCTPEAVGADEVHVLVDSPLPDALGGGCDGDPSGLDGLLLVGEDHCVLPVDADGVRGCCTALPPEQVAGLTLVFRRAMDGVPVAQQYKSLALGEGGTVAELSYPAHELSSGWNSDDDAASNLVEWCAGTL